MDMSVKAGLDKRECWMDDFYIDPLEYVNLALIRLYRLLGTFLWKWFRNLYVATTTFLSKYRNVKISIRATIY